MNSRRADQTIGSRTTAVVMPLPPPRADGPLLGLQRSLTENKELDSPTCDTMFVGNAAM